MKKIALNRLFLLPACILYLQTATGQSGSKDSPAFKNVISFNLGQLIVNEINMGYEHFIAARKSFELSAGFIYRNDVLQNLAEKWSNTQYFYEHGFALRFSHRIYRPESEKSKKKSFYGFGLNYQYLFFKDEWFTTDHEPTIYLRDSNGHVIDQEQGTEQILQHRYRNRIGIQFISGTIFPVGTSSGLEIFFGIGVRAVFSNRYDVAVSETGFGKTTVYDSGNRDQKLYFRPTVHAGLKFRTGW